MSFPISPFRVNFNTEILIKSQNDNTDEQDIKLKLTEVLRWLCTPPKISSYRINTLLYSVEEILLQIKEKLKNITNNDVIIELCSYLPDVVIVHNIKVEEVDLDMKALEVIVDVNCAAAVLRGAHVFAPGVMGMQSGIKVDDKVSIYADVGNNCRKGLQKSLDCPKKVFIGNGIAKKTRSDLFAENLKPSGVAVVVHNNISGCLVPCSDTLPTGSCILQNFPSILCSHVLNPQPGECVLDMCAAPGNKTTHIAALMKNKGTLIAIDKTPSKIQRLKENCKVFNANALIYQYDSCKSFDQTKNMDVFENCPPFGKERFDKILLDAPCSALGKRPQFNNNSSEKVIKSYVPLQRKLFQNAVQLLKVNGYLVYSTCTIAQPENECVVAWALNTFDCLELCRANPCLGEAGWPTDGLSADDLRKVQRFGPNSDIDSISQQLEKALADVELVEEHLLVQQAEYFIAKDSIINDPRANELSKLKSLGLTRDVPQSFANKYSLLTYGNLLPPLPERAIDFRLNSNRHLCEPCEPEMGICAPVKIKQPQEAVVSLTKNLRRHVDEQTFFEAAPKQIVFNDYELNVTYTKKIRLRNVTNVTHSITVKHPPKTKYFTITLQTTNRRAAGMCVVYTVTYKTDVYHDIKADKVVFNTFGGKDVVVDLKSTRSSPCLRIFILRTKTVASNPLKFDSLSNEFFDVDRTMALNASIDCGSTLIGDEVLLSIIMKNEGGTGRFFFVTETDWFCNNVEHISDDIELIVGAFRLYPAYFVIKENEFAEVVLSFYPKRYGLSVETVYLLCNNNTYEELDLIGDGIYFEKGSVTFSLKKKDSKPFFLDYQSEYCLHFGKCLACTKHRGFIRVSNNSSLNLSYRWMLRRSENENSKDFKHMTPHWITVKQFASLPPHSATDFDIVLYPETTSSGLYRMVLSLYIENIPEIGLRDHEEFTVLEKSNRDSETRLLDILAGEVELLCEVEKIDVIIEPNPLTVPFRLSDHTDCQQNVIVRSATNFPLRCEWVPHTTNNHVVIKPQRFKLDDVVNCKVFISRTDMEKIDDQFLLYVNDGVQKVHFKVNARVAVPCCALSITAIDFGHVMENFVYYRQFRVENPSRATVAWKISEDIVSLQEQQALCVEPSCNMVPNEGVLGEGESCAVRYTANTREQGEWLSYLKLYTNFVDEKSEKPDFVCGVQYTVCTPTALIHSDTSEFPILCLEDILYVGVPIQCKMCVHNFGNMVLILICGKPTGSSASSFDIRITPSIGIVNVQQNFQIDVRIVPKEMGYFEDVYIPVFILGCEKVKLVKLMCLVADITVAIRLPENYPSIVWPEIVPEIPEVICVGENDTFVPSHDYHHRRLAEERLEGSIEVICESNEHRSIPKSDADPSIVKRRLLETEDGHGLQMLYRAEPKNSVEEQGSWCPEASTDSLERTNPTCVTPTDCSITATSTTLTTEMGRSHSLRSLFEKHFDSELTLQDYLIEFKGVPLKTPVKKTIEIVNMTPGSGDVNAEVANFYPAEHPKDVLKELLAEIGMAKSTAWEDLIAANGIVLKIEQSNNSIGAYERIEIDVWVYANTWGLYLDEILIDISQLTPFCVSVLIEVVGLPVQFPIAQNSICREPTIRLGVVPYFVDSIKRKLKVVNASAVPITVSWHLFVNFDRPKKDFSVMFDMPDSELLQFSEEMLKGEFFLTNQYFGEPNTIHFDVEPLVSNIEPRGYIYVDITANIANFDDTLLDRQIEANLIGVIRTRLQFRYSSNIFVRPIGSQLPLTKVHITLETKCPKLIIDDNIRAIQMTGFATDIVESEFSRTKTIVLTNTSSCSSLVYIETEKPFRICSVKTAQLSVPYLVNCAELLPTECMEVTIECTVASNDVLKMVEGVKASAVGNAATRVCNDNSLVISRALNVYEGGYLRKVIPLEMKIFYPLFKSTPGSINFGHVYIGDTAKSVVTLKNLTCRPMKFEIYKCHKMQEIVVSPESGFIPRVGSGGIRTINVFFTPTEPAPYEEWIAITTTVAYHYVIISVNGDGTYDEKYHVSGLH
ncbi:hypothetical protein Trydic_g18642 [Trypoxylus dichotomus]